MNDELERSKRTAQAFYVARKYPGKRVHFRRAIAEQQHDVLAGRGGIMSFFARPVFAVGFGAFLVCGDTCLHLDDWRAVPQHWTTLPFLLDDWPAGLFLLYGAVASRRNWVSGRPYQAAAWGFNLHLLFASFLANLEDWSSSHATAHGWISDRALVVIIGVMLALGVCGLVSTLVSTSPPGHRSSDAAKRGL